MRFKANNGDETIVVELYPHRGGMDQPQCSFSRPT